MVATTNLPGSKYFHHFHGTKKECKQWLEDMKVRFENECGGNWASAWLPAMLRSEREFRTWRYRDGERVCQCLPNAF